MALQDFILIETLCSHYEVEFNFIDDLHKTGLIEIKTIEQKQFVHQDMLSDLEKIIRLHNELKINIEGIDVVFNLLNKVNELKDELNYVKNKLRIYEND